MRRLGDMVVAGLAVLAACGGPAKNEAVVTVGEPSTKVDKDYFKICVREVSAAAKVVEQNYAGYADKMNDRGGEISKALASARRVANSATSEAQCSEALGKWIKSFGDGHLGITMAAPAAPGEPRPPIWRRLSPKVGLVVLRSFQPEAWIAELADAQKKELSEVDTLIIDLRGALGAGDTAARPLWKWIYSEPIRAAGRDVLASEANAAAWSTWMDGLPEGEEKKRAAAALSRMKAKPGQLVPLVDDDQVEDEAAPKPSRVLLVVDASCAEACEEFLLVARQSRKVAIAGQPSRGLVDYSHALPHVLPSGKRTLLVPAGRSRRVPDSTIDGQGVAPDVNVDADELAGLDDKGLLGLVEKAFGK